MSENSSAGGGAGGAPGAAAEPDFHAEAWWESENKKGVAMRAAVRIRPEVEDEGGGARVGEAAHKVVCAEKDFKFDAVFGPRASQEAVYATCARPLVDGALRGFNACVMAFGHSHGAGKTHTMLHGEGEAGGEGVVPQALRELFEMAERRGVHSDFGISCTFLEVYKESVRDLIDPNNREEVKVQQKRDGEVVVSGLTRRALASAEEALQVIQAGNQHRTGAPRPRSHCMLTVHVEKTALVQAQRSSRAKLHFVDLAGADSETGADASEAIAINRSLLVLGKCINVLGNPKRGGHVPARDCILTRLLIDSLGGNSRTVMIACVSPDASANEDSLTTLRYASQSRGIVCKPKVNRSKGKGGGGGPPLRRPPGFRGAVHRWYSWVALRKAQQTAMEAELAAVQAAAEEKRQGEEAEWARQEEERRRREEAEAERRQREEEARREAEAKVTPAEPPPPAFDPLQAARDWVEANVRAQSQRLFPRPKPLATEAFKRVPMREGAESSGWFGSAKKQEQIARLQRAEEARESLELNEGRMILRGVLVFAGQKSKSKSGFTFSREVLEPVIERMQEKVRAGEALGEFDSPPTWSEGWKSVSYENVSHKVTEMHWHENDLVGTVEVLPTPAGMMLQDLVMAGMELGVQMRAYAKWEQAMEPGQSRDQAGTRKEARTDKRVKDVELIAWDFVPQHVLQQDTYVVPTRRKIAGEPIGYRAQVMKSRAAIIKAIHVMKRWKLLAFKGRAMPSRKPAAVKAKDMKLKDVWLATHQTMALK